MKLDKIASDKLKKRIQNLYADSELCYSEIAQISSVHSSQVSRICRGKFKTLSHNVILVCKTLGLSANTLNAEEVTHDNYQKLIAATALKTWDKTPEDAERIVRFLKELSRLRAPA